MEGREHEQLHIPDSSAENWGELEAAIRGKLMDGAFDVMQNSHLDAIVITDGQHTVEHQIDRAEAQQLVDASWSSGNDTTLVGLAGSVLRTVQAAGINLRGDHLGITVHVEAIPESMT